MAFLDALQVTIDGTTPKGERAKRTVQVCGPAAFVVIKAHALRGRRKAKDAYDLVFMLKNFGETAVASVVERFSILSGSPIAQEAITILAEDFLTPGHIGPKLRAEFLGRRNDIGVREDAVGFVRQFLDEVGAAAQIVPRNA